MNIRWLLTVLITFICGILFAFVPALNWFGDRKISMFDQFAKAGDISQFLWHLLVPVALVFFGLLFLFVIKAPRQETDTEEQKSDKSDEEKK